MSISAALPWSFAAIRTVGANGLTNRSSGSSAHRGAVVEVQTDRSSPELAETNENGNTIDNEGLNVYTPNQEGANGSAGDSLSGIRSVGTNDHAGGGSGSSTLQGMDVRVPMNQSTPELSQAIENGDAMDDIDLDFYSPTNDAAYKQIDGVSSTGRNDSEEIKVTHPRDTNGSPPAAGNEKRAIDVRV